jgi:radical SAM superfamily enzyme YgiQ (UPF0313 family)
MAKPVVALIGAEFEENLSIRYLASAVEADGFRAVIIPFNESSEAREIVQRVRDLGPLVVCISVPFQARAPELLALARDIKAKRVETHIAVGGHFATFEYDNILRDFPAVDSIVRHEGEFTVQTICARVQYGAGVVAVPGTVVRCGQDICVSRPARRAPRRAGRCHVAHRGQPGLLRGLRVLLHLCVRRER